MGYSRRLIFVKGLGTMEVLRVEPTVDTAFTKVGFLQKLTWNDEHSMVDIVGDNGHLLNTLSGAQKVFGVASMWQTSKPEIDLLIDAVEQAHAVRYYGPAGGTKWQYWGAQLARILPNVTLEFASATGRVLPLSFAALKDMETTYDHPVYWLVERDGDILMDSLALWTSPRQKLNVGTVYLIDQSGWKRYATLAPAGDVNTIWNVAATPYFLRFDGTDQYGSFGDVLDDDGSGDFAVEAWLKFPVGSVQQEVLTKKTVSTDDSAGWAIYKTAADLMALRIGSGAASAVVLTAGTITTTWKHFAATVDRNGNMTTYLNGVVSGTPVAVDTIATGTNALNLYLARDASNYGQVDMGDVRIYRWVAGGLPSNIATVMANHFAAEKAYYGVS